MNEKIVKVIEKLGFIIDTDNRKIVQSGGQKLKVAQQQQIEELCKLTLDTDITYKEILDDLFPQIKNEFNDIGETVETFVTTQLRSKIIYSAYNNSSIDERDLDLYKRFKIFVSDNGKIAYFVKRKPNVNEWVYLNGGEKIADRLYNLCTTLEPDDPSFHSFCDELNYKFNEPFNKVLKLGHNLNSANTALHKLVASEFPNSYLRHSAEIAVMGQKKTVKVNGEPFSYVGCLTDIKVCTYKNKQLTPVTAVENFVGEDLFKTKNNFHVKQPPVTLSNDSNTPAVHYVDLNSIVADGPCPTWDFYLRRFPGNQPEVLKAFIWSIFNAKNRKRQMLYLLDRKGGSGKSLLINCIASIIGENAVASLGKDSLNDKFAGSRVYGYPLTVIPDNKNPYLIKSERMHQILAHDMMPVEHKGLDPFSARIDTSVIAAGNTMLRLDTGAIHEKSRVIILTPTLDVYSAEELSKFYETVTNKDGQKVLRRDKKGDLILKGDGHFEQDLKSEFKQFLRVCRESYKELCTTDAEISLPDDVLDLLFNSSDCTVDIISEVIEKYFKFENGSQLFTPMTTIAKVIAIMNESEAQALPEKFKVEEFQDFVAKHFNVVLENGRPRVKSNDDKTLRPSGFFGVALTGESYKRLDPSDYALVRDPAKEEILEENNICEC